MTINKTVIITGANSGLGFECAKTIAKANQGWHIILACRNVNKGEEARQKLINETQNQAINVMELDLASLQSVRDFVLIFQKTNFPPLHGLINNAGMQVLNGLEYTKDGYEIAFGTNHLGHFLLTNLLLQYLQAPARIVVVSSGTHDPDTIEGKFNKPLFLGAKSLATMANEKEMTGIQRYATSKLANLFFAYELDRKLKGKNITVNAYDPAYVPATNLVQSIKNPLARWILRASTGFFKLLGVVSSTPDVSGGAIARLLLDEKLEGVSGKYFQILEEKQSSKQSYDVKIAEQLWEDSLELIGLKKK
jgi:light-dependent protochlorophyllide reductase